MRVTVCEFPDEQRFKDEAWADLTRHCRDARTDVVVLPEMPFCDWRMFMSREVDLTQWHEATTAHDEKLKAMSDLGGAAILSSRPIDQAGRRMNQAFAWSTEGGYVGAHCKYYLPDEPDGWEATWFHQGDLEFSPIKVKAIEVGFQICTELLFSDVSREIGRAGAHLIAAPRATSGHRRWSLAARMAAVMAGSFIASANRRSYDSNTFAGGSWLISPEAEVLAETTADEPYITVEIDPSDAEMAKHSYPRNIYMERSPQ